jgi:plastocyanin
MCVVSTPWQSSIPRLAADEYFNSEGQNMNRSSLIFNTIVVLGLLTAGVFASIHSQSPRSNYVAVSPSEAHAATDTVVSIDNFSFMSATLTVPAGTKVTWINHDDVPHTIVSTEQKFKSKALDTDESFSFTFTEPGTYPYFCSLHPKMVAKVIVEAKK